MLVTFSKITIFFLFFINMYCSSLVVEMIENYSCDKKVLYDFFQKCFEESGNYMTAEKPEEVIAVILKNEDYQTVLFYTDQNELVGFMTWYYFLPHDLESDKVCYDNDRVLIDNVNSSHRYLVHIPFLKILDSHKKKAILKEAVSRSVEIIKNDYKHRIGSHVEKIYFGVFLENRRFRDILDKQKSVQKYTDSKTCNACMEVWKNYGQSFLYYLVDLTQL
jgi:hypothetical protein